MLQHRYWSLTAARHIDSEFLVLGGDLWAAAAAARPPEEPVERRDPPRRPAAWWASAANSLVAGMILGVAFGGLVIAALEAGACPP